MTNNRLLRILRGEQADRIPVAPFIHVNFVREFFHDFHVDAVVKTIDVYEHFGFDIIHRNCTPAYNDVSDIRSDNWSPVKIVTPIGPNQIITTKIDTPEGVLQETSRINRVSTYDEVAAVTEFLIKTEKDFQIIRKYQPPVGPIDTSPIQRAKTLLDEKGIAAPWVQGVFNQVCLFYRKLDDLIIDMMLNPGFYHSLMDYFLGRNKQIIAQFAQAEVDLVSYGANVASGKLIGPDFFAKYIFPYEKALIDFIKDQGLRVLYHNCGDAMKLFDVYKLLGMNMYESLTPPPLGDTILENALTAMPREITLAGNIDQITFLRKATTQHVRTNVRQLLETAKPRGNFILSTTDYLLEQTPYVNLFALSQAGKDFGGY